MRLQLQFAKVKVLLSQVDSNARLGLRCIPLLCAANTYKAKLLGVCSTVSLTMNTFLLVVPSAHPRVCVDALALIPAIPVAPYIDAGWTADSRSRVSPPRSRDRQTTAGGRMCRSRPGTGKCLVSCALAEVPSPAGGWVSLSAFVIQQRTPQSLALLQREKGKYFFEGLLKQADLWLRT